MSVDQRRFGRPLVGFRNWLAALGCLGFLAAGSTQAAPRIQSWQAPSGARVLFVAAPDIPMVDVRVVFDAGSARDGQRSGLASMTAAMLTEGAGDWDANAFAKRLEDIGARISASADRDMTAVSLRTLTRSLAFDTAVDTLAAVLVKPRFSADDLERVRKNRLIGLRQEEESPQTVGMKALYKTIFGTHPYAPSPSGIAESINVISREDLVDFHKRFYRGGNAVVAIVGALDRAGAEALAQRITVGLPAGERAAPIPPVADLPSTRAEIIAFPSSQTTVLAGQPGMRRGDPDYFALYLGNHILGGSGLVSLLMQEIREKRGLSYSTFSYFVPLAQPGPFMLGLQTKNAQADQARAVLLHTLERFIEAGPTAAELAAAKKNLTGGFPLRIASNSDIVQYLAAIGFYGLPLDYLDRFTGRIDAISAEQIRDAFARRVHPDRLALVLVGKPSDVKPQPSGDQ